MPIYGYLYLQVTQSGLTFPSPELYENEQVLLMILYIWVLYNSDNNQFSLVVYRHFSATYQQCSKLVGSKHIQLWGHGYSRHWEKSSKGKNAVRHTKMQWSQSFTQCLKIFVRFLSAAKWETQMRDTTQLLYNRWVKDTGHRYKHNVRIWLQQANACTWMSMNFIGYMIICTL